ncbi:MAG TPA: hypothetical protein VNE86_07170, partial [Nitrososphaerales archaeon]|nr:hypothetical protein [Nitrososphaerales archaeon]
MEAQLQQSIPKKTHQEVVAKMQATIDGLNAEFERVKADLQKTVSLNETIAGIGSNITSQNETITSLGVTVKNQNQIIEEQNKAIGGLNSRLSQSTVPVLLYDQALSKVEEMQEKIRCMVDKVDYASIQTKCDELSESIKSMVPREDYLNLQNQFANFVPRESFEALQRTLSQYVPRDQLVTSETRVHELEARLENYVPRSDYEELTARIALLAKEASALSVDVPQAVLETKIAPAEQVSPAETTPPVETIPIAEPIAVVVEQPQIHDEKVSQILPNLVATEQPIAESVATVEAPISVSTTVQEVVAKVTEVTPEVKTIQETIAVETVPEALHAEAVVETPLVESVTVTSPTEAIVEIPSIPAVEIQVEQIVEQTPHETRPEITEIQAQLSEIKGVEDSGITTIQAKIVDTAQGFVFANTTFCARSGLEFLQDLEQTPIETIQNHMIGGDFERWFKEALTDDSSAESLRSIRESNFTGEELRAKIVAVIAPQYKS